MDAPATELIKQHLIDPEICIRCNTCEATCPVSAITHDSRNYVVDVGKCAACLDCIAPCPTGAIDNWRWVPRGKSYSVAEQLLWDELPPELTPSQLAVAGVAMPASLPVTNAVDTPGGSAALLPASRNVPSVPAPYERSSASRLTSCAASPFRQSTRSMRSTAPDPAPRTAAP